MQSIDFFPTIASLIGQDPPPAVQGRAWGAGREYSLSEVYCAYCKSGSDPSLARFRREQVAVIDRRKKLIFSTASDSEVFYDLELDPMESAGGPLPETEARLRELSAQALEDRRQNTYRPDSARDTETQGLDDKLRSLGYIQ